MFATMIIVLPSEFTGGAAHLSHGRMSSIVDCSQGSMTQTTIPSWYTDVTHEIKPITSGYRLALSFNLMHSNACLRPALPVNNSVIKKLRHILLSWKQKKRRQPAQDHNAAYEEPATSGRKRANSIVFGCGGWI